MSSFEPLLEIDDSTNTHEQNPIALAAEIYKVSHNLSLLFKKDIFTEWKLQH